MPKARAFTDQALCQRTRN